MIKTAKQILERVYNKGFNDRCQQEKYADIDNQFVVALSVEQALKEIEALIQQAELRGQVHIIKQEHSWISDVNDGIAYNLEKTIEQLEAQLKTLAGKEVSRRPTLEELDAYSFGLLDYDPFRTGPERTQGER